MTIMSWFTKRMKGEPRKRKQQSRTWVIDESKYLNINEVRLLREVAEGRRRSGLRERRFAQIRSWFMVELGLNAGLRVGEMASLRHGDLRIDSHRSSIVVLGKGQKKRAIWISTGFKRTCRAYLDLKRRLGYSTEGASFLLSHQHGSSISKRTLQKAFRSMVLQAELASRYSIHCLRHTYTTFLLKASGHNYRFVQQQLGHASIRTTQVYAGILESEGKKALERLYR